MKIKLNSKGQLADEVLNLEIAYLNLWIAYNSGDKMRMSSAINATRNNNPYYETSLEDGMDSVFKELFGDKFFKDDFDNVPIECMKLNVIGCLRVIEKALMQNKFYETNCLYAQRILYLPNHIFTNDEVLYHNQEGQQLKVTDLLKVYKYAIGVAEAIAPDNEGFAKANAAISAFQALGAILSNKPEDKPVNKTLHLVVSFLSSEVKKSLQENETKRDVIITTMLLDLAIDFFCINN